MLLLTSYWVFKKDTIISEKQKEKPKVEEIRYFKHFLNCESMDSIMRLDSIKAIHLHKDSFEMPDSKIIDNYIINNTALKDSIIFTKLK